MIDRKTKEVSDVPWLADCPIYCTGLQWAPSFHPTELSIVFIRDPNGVHMLNTQTWHSQTLINVSDGSAKFPDLSLLEIADGSDHTLMIYTVDKTDKILIKRTYSHMLKYCLQTASIRANCFKPEALRKRIE